MISRGRSGNLSSALPVVDCVNRTASKVKAYSFTGHDLHQPTCATVLLTCRASISLTETTIPRWTLPTSAEAAATLC